MLHFDRWKIVLIYVLCIAGLVYTAPNFIPKSQLNDVPDWLPNQQINLGLDLRGGSYLLLGLETDALVRERLQDLVNEVRSELRDESIPYTGLGIHNGQVVVNITNAADAERAREAIDGLSSVVAGNQFSALPERDLLIDVEGQTVSIGLSEAAKRARVQSAVQQSIEIVRRRIDDWYHDRPPPDLSAWARPPLIRAR